MCSALDKNPLNTLTAAYCYVQKVQFFIIIFVPYDILYLQALTIKNIQIFSSIISTTVLGPSPNVKANSIACFLGFSK